MIRICDKTCDKTCDKPDFTKNQKPAKPVTTGIYGFMCMVEARRVELLSESLSIGFSPGAVDLFSFPIPDADQQASDISSS